jgi:hypothetical protein
MRMVDAKRCKLDYHRIIVACGQFHPYTLTLVKFNFGQKACLIVLLVTVSCLAEMLKDRLSLLRLTNLDRALPRPKNSVSGQWGR